MSVSSDPICSAIEEQVQELRLQLELMQDELGDPELTLSRKAELRRQIVLKEKQLAGAKARLRACLASEFMVAGVEFTQATQFFNFNGQGSGFAPDNSVPLIQFRPLVVRAYVHHKTAASGGIPHPVNTLVTGRLTYERTSPTTIQFPGLGPMNGPIVARHSETINRDIADHTLNFRIPAAHCQGTLRFHLEVFEHVPVVTGALAKAASPQVPNGLSVTRVRTFAPVPALRVQVVPLRYTGLGLDIPPVSPLVIGKAFVYVAATYPIASLHFVRCLEHEFDGDLSVRDSEDPDGGCGPGWNDLMDMLRDLRGCEDPQDIVVGILPRGVNTADVGGCGSSRRGVAVAIADDGITLAHEIGHALRRKHAPCGNPLGVDPDYPVYGSFQAGSIGEVGFNTSTSQTFHPLTSTDFMTYCRSKWVSPYTYLGIRDGMLERFGETSRAAVGPTATELLTLSFTLHGGKRVELRPAFHQPGFFPHVNRQDLSPLVCQLWDQDGNILSSHRCQMPDHEHTLDAPLLYFDATLLWSDKVHSLVILRDGKVLYTQEVEHCAPALSALNVHSSERSRNRVTLEWTAQAARAPTYRVLYSNDGGERWQTIRVNLNSPCCEVNLARLSGGERCMFKVLASSGLRTSSITTSPFAVARRTRQLHILSPQDGDSFAPGESVVLRGGAFSLDYGLSALEETTWTSNRDGVLGIGHEVLAQGLSLGMHQIVLTAPDGAGGVIAAPLTLYVRPTPASE